MYQEAKARRCDKIFSVMNVKNEERIVKMPAKKYKEIFGVEKYVFDRLLRLLEIADTYQRKSQAGRKAD